VNVTTIAIGLGLAAALPHTAIRLHQGAFNAGAAVTVFLSGTAIPLAIHSIYAAVQQDKAELPANWPAYLALAGVVMLGVSADKLQAAYRDLFGRKDSEPKG